jgi:TPR repeat protein
MALLPLFRSRTNEVELERRIYALQTALDQCKGVARTWWSMRVRFTVAVALVAMAAGFALGVYRHSIKQAFVDSAVAVGLATLGVMYGEGRGVPQDYAEAARWYRLAADQGDAQAQYNLGLAYARGEGVTQNVVDAHMWFNLAAARFPANDTRNRTAAVKNRDTVAGEMSSEQLAEAQKRAREWKPRS